MENLLTGEELIRQKAILQRDFPSSGSREFAPTNTWLEKKQIQTCLDDKHALLKSERIEKTVNLSTAEWIPDVNKAKLTKKNGKYWEVFGHANDNSDWLYPEEALFLLEINALQIFLGQVPVSIEQGYLLLIGNGCTLNEYYVFSSLSKKGYKLIRHDKDAINQNLDTDKTTKDCITIDCVDDKSNAKEIIEEKNFDVSASSSDVFIIEDEIEIIEVDSDSPDSNIKPEKTDEKTEKNKDPNDSILIESDEDDVVYLPSTSKSESRSWYKPLKNSLIPLQEELTVHTKFKEIDYFDLKNKNVLEILKNIDGSNKEIMSSPDDRFIPDEIKPSHSKYKVNLREFFDNSKDYENENPNERIPERPPRMQINNRVRRYLQRPYNYQESSDNNYNTNPGMELISPQFQNFNNPFQRPCNHRDNHSNFPTQFMNNEIPQFPDMPHVRDNNVLAQAFVMRLMAVNMMNTAYNLLATPRPPFQQPYLPMQNPAHQRYQNNYSNFNRNPRYQRNWTPRYRGSRKRPRYNVSPNFNQYETKNRPTTSKIEIVQDCIVLDSDEDEKESKKQIKTSNFTSKPNKKFECIDITGDVTPTHIRFPDNEEVDENKPQVSQTENNECDSKSIIENNNPELVKQNEDEMDIDIPDVSNETPEIDLSAENTQPSNWEQYKKLPSTQKDIIDPLVNLDEIDTINAKVYESFQIFKPFTISPDKGKQYKISFDVYAPNEPFKKSTKALPKFRIIVQSTQDILPSKYDIDVLKNFYKDGVPFLIAVVLEESISYYMYDCVTIPNLF